MEYRGGIDFLNSMSEKLNKTLQKLKLLETRNEVKRLFLYVERKLYLSETNVPSPNSTRKIQIIACW